jgi:hypothetical protein
MKQLLSPLIIAKLNEELGELDKEMIQVNGRWVHPSNCYRVSENLPQILFNTDCPDELKKRVQDILNKYGMSDEGNPHE